MRIQSINCTLPSVKSVCNTNNTQHAFEGKFSNGLEKPHHVKEFYAYRDFARYNPQQKNFGTYTIPVHNEAIAGYLKSEYTSKSFDRLFSFSEKKGVFDYVIDEKKGVVKTSFIKSNENTLMSDLVWITDSCNNMILVKNQHPKDCVKVLNCLADLYEGQQKNFDEIIENPSLYHDNGFWPQNQKGVGHCFVPQTKQPHKWFARTRLESIGNYLQTSADIIQGGFRGEKYGYKSVDDIPDSVVNSIANCVKYLDAIHYPTARSCGAWEEQTFVNSLTSDTSIINQGMRDMLKLMYAPTDDINLLILRSRIKNSKHGDIFDDKKHLTKLLREGEQRVREQADVETSKGNYSKVVKPHEEKCLAREFDAALSFMPQTETLNPHDIYRDSAKKLFLLRKLCNNIVRPNGAIRYPQDEYLNLDYHQVKATKGRNKKSHEAEWFLVSEIASAYGAVAKNLLNHIEKTGHANEKDIKLLTCAIKGQTEYINRSYARISPKGMTKSNGYSCPPYKLPEAYEAVTTKNGTIKYVPGAHTLTWAAASLYKASESFASNLKQMEILGL